MLNEIYGKICAGQDIRANLIELKLQLKSPKNQAEFRKICRDNYDVIMRLLVHEDAKVRKNAAAILGSLQVQEAVDVLMDAYLEEEKLFVRSDYVSALAELDCGEYLDVFHKRQDELAAYDAPENEKKHVQEELRAIRELLLRKEGVKKHTFTGFYRPNEVILTTLPVFRDVLAEAVTSKKTLLKAGVKTVVNDMHELLGIRTWNEMLFPLNCGKLFPDPEKIAAALAASDLMMILDENHSSSGHPEKNSSNCGARDNDREAVQNAPYYFRVGVTGSMTAEERSNLTKKTASAIEEASGQRLINNVSHYEIELRLIPDKDGLLTPYLKLYTIPDQRFRYRKQHVAASMKPYLAAGLLALAKPYLRDYAQVLDPFCGVGTLLVERRFVAPVRNSYGIDTFGEAIEKARTNTRTAGLQINYINRDYFDFEHDYLFDEIITDMPAGSADKEELDQLYRRFLEKSAEVLVENGRVICYSREMGLIKKHLRLNRQFRLLKEFCISQKNGTYLFIMEKN